VWLYSSAIVLWFYSIWSSATSSVVGTRQHICSVPVLAAAFIVILAWWPAAAHGADVLAVLVFVVEYGVSLISDCSIAVGGRRAITVLSFNTWGYSQLPETAQAIVSSGTPDIVVLQSYRVRLRP